MVSATSKRLVEELYGRDITDAEFSEALDYALMKLNFQSELFHRDYDTKYVTQVVMETVNQNRLDALHQDINRMRRKALEDKRRYEIMDTLGISLA